MIIMIMNRKELAKTCMINLNLKPPLVTMVYKKIFQRCKGLTLIQCRYNVMFPADLAIYQNNVVNFENYPPQR